MAKTDPRARRPLLGAALAVALSACALPEKDHSSQARNPELWPQVKPAIAPDATAQINKKVDLLLAQMTVAQKVGQITQAEMGYVTPEQVKQFHLGSVLNSGGGFLGGNKSATVDDWLTAMDAYYDASTDTSAGGLAIPILWGTDAVHGHNKIVGATIFPHNIGLGATRNGDLVRRISEITAIQVRVTGINWTFSPALSVVRNDRWGRAYESYSEDPKLVSDLGKQSVLGYQGDLSKTGRVGDERIAATAKHFVADGATRDGIDRGHNYDSEERLIENQAYPYFDAIEAGVLSIMASHSTWQGSRLHGERYLLTDILKKRVGFDGFVVGDWNSHGLVDGCTNTRCPAVVNAGVDMLMVPIEWEEFIRNTIADVESGQIPMTRLDDAVRRILRTKFRAGIMDGVRPSQRLHAGNAALLNAPEFERVARQAVRESLVLLKNNEQLLPLSPQLNVLVAGAGANNIAQQSGGWSISWQSRNVTNEDFPNATSIYEGIEQTVSAAGGAVELAEDGDYTTKPDVAIVVYGEQPYAEWQGDLRHLGYQTGEHSDAKLLEKLQADGINTISVFLSGRPLWVNRALNASDAFVAAWLPGTEGSGIAEVLFTRPDGSVQYDFSGTLPFSWPRTLDQTEVNIGDEDYNPLFPFGYGLTYRDEIELSALPTEEDIRSLKDGLTTALFVGSAQDPWRVFAVAPNRSDARYLSGSAKNGAITLNEATRETKGDAIHATWKGDQSAALQINNPNANSNFEALLNENGALVFDIRLLRPATQPVGLEMACASADCATTLEITAPLNGFPVNEWREFSIPLRCFAEKGIDFNEVTRAFGLITAGKLELQVAKVRLLPDIGVNAKVRCPQPGAPASSAKHPRANTPAFVSNRL